MRREKQKVMIATFILTMLVGALSAFAQERAPKPPPKNEEEDVVIFERHIGPPAMPGADTRIELLPGGGGHGPGGDTFVFVSTEMSFGSKLVKNAPYSAQAVTETTQTLADGNRIVRKNSSSIYRDSEGRTRHDQSLGSIGPWAAAGEPKQTSFINDPVGRVHYVLDPRSRIARKMVLPPLPPMPDKPSAPPVSQRDARPGDVLTVMVAPHPPGMRERHTRDMALPKPKVESLGKQNIEGVEAEGTRDTITIPAGEIGNEQPIQIVSERWYSPELQTVVLTRHSDPRFGETTFRLTNINRTEPARSLFEVPSDYTVKEGPSHMRTIRRKQEDKRSNE
ncbi:MAG TPA: hypothetical protein VEQ40_09035 [Pyrinomonadaceae bacterium]|nr:hypothetical protein [Pyrinomonadaceae bacterium]